MSFPWTKVKTAFSFFFQSKSKYRIHSPFVYGLITSAIEGNEFENKNLFEKTAQLKSEAFQKNETFNYSIQGAGSVIIDNKKVVSVRKLLTSAVSSINKLKFIYKVASYCKPSVIIEVGTSLGLSSFVLNNVINSKFVGFEPVKELADYTDKLLKHSDNNNWQLFQEPFEGNLVNLNFRNEIVFFYFDGNHTKEGLRSFMTEIEEIAKMNTIFCLIDDIRWSDEMFEEWKKVELNKSVSLSLDFFQMSFISFEKKFQKEKFKIFNVKSIRYLLH